MTRTGITVITVILTYAIRKLGFWSFNYDPMVDSSTLTGIIIDVSLWVVVFSLTARVLERMIPVSERWTRLSNKRNDNGKQ